MRRPLFATLVDEAAFSTALRAAIPDIRFIDGQRWPTAQPPQVGSIDQARSVEVFLWDPGVIPALPSVPRPSGDFQGPIVGPVIQVERCALIDGELRSGSIAATAPDGTPEAAFMATVLQTLRTLTTADVVTMDGGQSPYWIGADARRWALADPRHRLRHRSVLAGYVRIRVLL